MYLAWAPGFHPPSCRHHFSLFLSFPPFLFLSLASFITWIWKRCKRLLHYGWNRRKRGRGWLCEPEAGGSRCTFRERYGFRMGVAVVEEERRGGWVATVPCQALRGRLFIPWICIFCPLPFLTSCYPASMISSVDSSYCSRSSTRNSLCVRMYMCFLDVSIRTYVYAYVCVSGWMDVCTRRVGEFTGSSARSCASRICPRGSLSLPREFTF